jgi:RimJ/RimL family protein N-acetyltransferase
VSVRLRPAGLADVAFLVDLLTDPAVSPFLAVVRPRDAEGLAAEIERAAADPGAGGVLVVEQGDASVGTVAWERVNRRSAIASVGGLAIAPGARGRGVGREAMEELVRELFERRGLHRIELEVYGFNEAAAAFFERVGFVREGVRRLAYRRDDGWVDGIRFGLVVEDL